MTPGVLLHPRSLRDCVFLLSLWVGWRRETRPKEWGMCLLSSRGGLGPHTRRHTPHSSEIEPTPFPSRAHSRPWESAGCQKMEGGDDFFTGVEEVPQQPAEGAPEVRGVIVGLAERDRERER